MLGLANDSARVPPHGDVRHALKGAKRSPYIALSFILTNNIRSTPVMCGVLLFFPPATPAFTNMVTAPPPPTCEPSNSVCELQMGVWQRARARRSQYTTQLAQVGGSLAFDRGAQYFQFHLSDGFIKILAAAYPLFDTSSS